MPRSRPLAEPSNGFIDVAPIEVLHNVRQTYSKLEESRSPRPINYDQLYITDDVTVYEWASRKVFLFRTCKFLYWLLRWMFDLTSFKPTWHSVLYVDDIVEMGRPIYVTDTLVLHCQSIEAFEKLIPYICGPYIRLSIHGDVIKLHQLKRLMKGTVRKVEITANITLKSNEYDDTVQLIIQHVHGFRDNFNLKSTPQLTTKVKSAVEGDRYLRAENNLNECNVVYWTSRWHTAFFVLLIISYIMISLHSPLGKVVTGEPIRPISNYQIINFALKCATYVFHFVFSVNLLLFFSFKSKPTYLTFMF